MGPIFPGPAWAGWMRYHEFAESVKSDLRFVRSESASKFLDDVKKSCKRRALPISQKSLLPIRPVSGVRLAQRVAKHAGSSGCISSTKWSW